MSGPEPTDNCGLPDGVLHSHAGVCYRAGYRDGLHQLREHAGPGPYEPDGDGFKAPTWQELRDLADHNFLLFVKMTVALNAPPISKWAQAMPLREVHRTLHNTIAMADATLKELRKLQEGQR